MRHAMYYLQQNQPALAQQISQFLQTEQNHDSDPVLTAIGLYNAGKSTLLNALTDNLKSEVFKTARVRETRSLKKLSHDKVVYQDTPGLDAEQQDDETAFEAVASSDLLLLCHSVTLGELDQPTLDYLQRIQQQSGLPLGDRLICVLTKAEDDAKAQSARELVRQQLIQLTGQAPEIFCVSSKSYERGITDQKRLLVNGSGIPQLKAHLQDTLQHQRQQLQQIRLQQRQSQAHQLIAQVEQALHQQQQNYVRQFKQAEQKFTHLGRVLTNSRDRLQAL